VSNMSSQVRKRKIVNDFFQCVTEGKPKEGLRFFAIDCKQHNPYVNGGMPALMAAMSAVQREEEETPKHSDPDFAVKHVLVDGDMVAVHTELLSSKSKPGEGGLRQVHLFRFGSDDKIVEYWDITQEVEPSMPNAGNAF
jgi:predicted SnoaL-like aldol condensation-catalyzing enzyme